MTPSALDKVARRARKALRHATTQALDATTERAARRHERRASQARLTLARLDYDTRQHGRDLAEA